MRTVLDPIVRVFNWTPALLLALILGTGAMQGCENRGDAGQLRPQTSSTEAGDPAGGPSRDDRAALLYRAADGEQLRVIVLLDIEILRDGERVPLAEIDAARRAVIADLAQDRAFGSSSVAPMQYAAALRAHVDEAGLQALLAHPGVRNVYEDVAIPLQSGAPHPLDIIHARSPENPDLGLPGPTDDLTGAGQAIAVLDTGVLDLPLQTGLNIVAEACFSTAIPSNLTESFCPALVSTQGGVVDEPGSAQPCAIEGCFHGTHVAGIVAGDVPGVAPGADIIAVQVASDHSIPMANAPGAPVLQIQTGDVLDALSYIFHSASLQFDIAAINMSLGSFPPPGAGDCTGLGAWDPAISSLRGLGIATVASTGNDASFSAVGYPACLADVIAVGATNRFDIVAPFSNAAPGPGQPDLLAPGAGISSYSLSPPALVAADGTSQAAPHVSGCIALLAEFADRLGRPETGNARVDLFLNAMTSTGMPIADWRDYSIVTPRLDCGAALRSLDPSLDDHLATISGRVLEDTTNDGIGDAGIAGRLVEAYSLDGHPAFTTVTDANGEYSLVVPWGSYRLGETRFETSTIPQFWNSVSTPGAVQFAAGGPDLFPNVDFVDRRGNFCPAGQTYYVTQGGRRDHFQLDLDSSSYGFNQFSFYLDRYQPSANPLLQIDEVSHSNRPTLEGFALGNHPASELVMRAQFDFGLRPVAQPPTWPSGDYMAGLERNDAIWLLFPDAAGLLYGSPTVWGRGLGNGSLVGAQLSVFDGPWEYDYPPGGSQTGERYTREIITLSTPGLPMQGVGSGPALGYIDGDLRPMMNRERAITYFIQDDTAVDFMALQYCTGTPQISITKTPGPSEFALGHAFDMVLVVTNLTTGVLDGVLQVTDELPPGLSVDSNGLPPASWGGADWQCTASSGDGGDGISCTYQQADLAASVATTITVPLIASQAGTHQNCVSADRLLGGEIIDHADACTVYSVGEDVGARKRRSSDIVRWGEDATFTLELTNFGRELQPGDTISLIDDFTDHTGFAYVNNSLNSGMNWDCSGTTPPALDCQWTGPIPLAGFQPDPLGDGHGYPLLPNIQFDVRGTETGFFRNCLQARFNGVADQNPGNDEWCLHLFVQGDIEIAKSFVSGTVTGDIIEGDVFDFQIDVTNLAGEIAAPLAVRVQDSLPSGLQFQPGMSFIDWQCAYPSATSILCDYTALPALGSNTPPTTPGYPLTPLKLRVIAPEAGVYRNCAEGGIEILPGTIPTDSQLDAITPPDPAFAGVEPEYDYTNNASCVPIIVGHDVRLSKTAGVPSAAGGTLVDFNFALTNHLNPIGPNDTLHVVDHLPPGFVYDANINPNSSLPGQWSCVPGPVTALGQDIFCSMQTGPNVYGLVNGIYTPIPGFTLQVNLPLVVGSYENCADFSAELSDDPDGDEPAGNTNRCATVSIPGDVSVTKAASGGASGTNPQEFHVGQPVSYTILVTNNGDIIDPAITALQFVDNLPSALNYVPSSLIAPAGWVCTGPAGTSGGGQISCSTTSAAADIANGEILSFTYQATAAAPGIHTNCIDLTLQNASNEGNGQDCDTIIVGHNVTLTKTVDDAIVFPGEFITYTINAHNALTTIQPGETIAVSDALPAGQSAVVWPQGSNPGGWECDAALDCVYNANGAVIVHGQSLPPLEITVLVNAEGSPVNCATVALTLNDGQDDVPGDEQSCQQIQVADVEIEKLRMICGWWIPHTADCSYVVALNYTSGLSVPTTQHFDELVDLTAAQWNSLGAVLWDPSLTNLTPCPDSGPGGLCTASAYSSGSGQIGMNGQMWVTYGPNQHAATFTHFEANNCVATFAPSHPENRYDCVEPVFPAWPGQPPSEWLEISKTWQGCNFQLSPAVCTYQLVITGVHNGPLSLLEDHVNAGVGSITMTSNGQTWNCAAAPYLPEQTWRCDAAGVVINANNPLVVTVTAAITPEVDWQGVENCATLWGPNSSDRTACVDVDGPVTGDPVLNLTKQLTGCTAAGVCTFEFYLHNSGGAFNGTLGVFDVPYDPANISQAVEPGSTPVSSWGITTQSGQTGCLETAFFSLYALNCTSPVISLASNAPPLLVHTLKVQYDDVTSTTAQNCFFFRADQTGWSTGAIWNFGACIPVTFPPTPVLEATKQLDSCDPNSGVCVFAISISNVGTAPFSGTVTVEEYATAVGLLNFPWPALLSQPPQVSSGFTCTNQGLWIFHWYVGCSRNIANLPVNGAPITFNVSMQFPLNGGTRRNCVRVRYMNSDGVMVYSDEFWIDPV